MTHFQRSALVMVIAMVGAAGCNGVITGGQLSLEDVDAGGGGQVDSTPGAPDASPIIPGDPDAAPPPPDAAPLPDAVPPPDAVPVSGDFCESQQVISIEAEHYSAQTGYSQITHGDASGGVAMQVGDNGSLDFEVYFASTGTYYFWVRTLAADSESNGLYLAIDGELVRAPPSNPHAGVADIYLYKSDSYWFWEPLFQGAGSGASAVAGPVIFDVTAGQHTVSVRKRKMERPLIDKLVLTVAGDQPSGMGPNETTCP